jgi:hypothetical protein
VRVFDYFSIGHILTRNETGGPFEIERLKSDELKDGEWQSSWVPLIDHPSIPPERAAGLSRFFTAGIILAISANAFVVSDEWNRLLPDVKFTQPEEFLTEAWRGRP